MNRLLVILAGLACATPSLSHARSEPIDAVGDTYEIRLQVETESASSDGMASSSSHDDWLLIERVVAVAADGVELEFDLPPDQDETDRALNWQFPIRVMKRPTGALELLNEAELQARVGPWLEAAGLTREQCGTLMFTWTAFRIECDPRTALEGLRRFDLRAELSEGANYSEPNGLSPRPLSSTENDEGRVFTVVTPIDPAVFRRQDQATAEAIEQLSGGRMSASDPVFQDKIKAVITGEITTTFHVDAHGRVNQRRTLTRIDRKDSAGVFTRSTSTETVNRRMIDTTGD